MDEYVPKKGDVVKVAHDLATAVVPEETSHKDKSGQIGTVLGIGDTYSWQAYEGAEEKQVYILRVGLQSGETILIDSRRTYRYGLSAKWVAKAEAKYGITYQELGKVLDAHYCGMGDLFEEYQWELEYIAKHGCLTYIGFDDEQTIISHEWFNDPERKVADYPLPEELRDIFRVIDMVKVANAPCWLLASSDEFGNEEAYWLKRIPK